MKQGTVHDIETSRGTVSLLDLEREEGEHLLTMYRGSSWDMLNAWWTQSQGLVIENLNKCPKYAQEAFKLHAEALEN